MINCLDCKYYSSNPYLRCAVNPTALGGCEVGEVGKPLKQTPLPPSRDYTFLEPEPLTFTRVRVTPDIPFRPLRGYEPEEVINIYRDAALNNLGRLP